MQHLVAVVGAGDATDDEREVARAVGRGLAAAGVGVVCGGLGGVMGAVAEGVADQGGFCIGLVPGPDRRAGHPALSVALPTGLGEARNVLVARAAEAMIAIGGEYGTLSEIAFARKLGTTVIGIDTWRLGDAEGQEHVTAVSSAEEAVAAALEAIGR